MEKTSSADPAHCLSGAALGCSCAPSCRPACAGFPGDCIAPGTTALPWQPWRQLARPAPVPFGWSCHSVLPLHGCAASPIPGSKSCGCLSTLFFLVPKPAVCCLAGNVILNIVTTEHVHFALPGDPEPNSLLFAALQADEVTLLASIRSCSFRGARHMHEDKRNVEHSRMHFVFEVLTA